MAAVVTIIFYLAWLPVLVRFQNAFYYLGSLYSPKRTFILNLYFWTLHLQWHVDVEYVLNNFVRSVIWGLDFFHN